MLQSLESRRILQEEPREEPLLNLTTQDRHSGKSESELLVYRRDNQGRFIVLATNDDSHRKPGWYLNLKEDPLVQLEVDGATFYARAITPTGTRRLQLRARLEIERLYPVDTIPRDTAIVVLNPMG